MKYVYAITGYYDAWADVVGQQAKLQHNLDTEPKILVSMMKLYDVTNYPEMVTDITTDSYII